MAERAFKTLAAATRASLIFSSVVLVLVACGPRSQLDHIDMSKQAPQDVAGSFSVRTYEGSSPHPNVSSFIESIHATSCKNLAWDPPATKGNALQQLRMKAHRLGANAIINVYFDAQGTDAWGTNCWQSITATGDAVVGED